MEKNPAYIYYPNHKNYTNKIYLYPNIIKYTSLTYNDRQTLKYDLLTNRTIVNPSKENILTNVNIIKSQNILTDQKFLTNTNIIQTVKVPQNSKRIMDSIDIRLPRELVDLSYDDPMNK